MSIVIVHSSGTSSSITDFPLHESSVMHPCNRHDMDESISPHYESLNPICDESSSRQRISDAESRLIEDDVMDHTSPFSYMSDGIGYVSPDSTSLSESPSASSTSTDDHDTIDSELLNEVDEPLIDRSQIGDTSHHSQIIDFQRRLILNGQVDGHNATYLVDPGADQCIIDERFVLSHNINTSNRQALTIEAFNGHRVTTRTWAKPSTIAIGTHEYDPGEDLPVVNLGEDSPDMILSVSWCHTYNIHIDFNNLTVELHDARGIHTFRSHGYRCSSITPEIPFELYQVNELRIAYETCNRDRGEFIHGFKQYCVRLLEFMHRRDHVSNLEYSVCLSTIGTNSNLCRDVIEYSNKKPVDGFIVGHESEPMIALSNSLSMLISDINTLYDRDVNTLDGSTKSELIGATNALYQAGLTSLTKYFLSHRMYCITIMNLRRERDELPVGLWMMHYYRAIRWRDGLCELAHSLVS